MSLKTSLRYLLLVISIGSILARPLRFRNHEIEERSVHSSTRGEEMMDLFEGDIYLRSGENPYAEHGLDIVKRNSKLEMGGDGSGDTMEVDTIGGKKPAEETEKPSPIGTEQPSPEEPVKPSPEGTEKPSPEGTVKPSPEGTEKPSPEGTEKPSPGGTEKPSEVKKPWEDRLWPNGTIPYEFHGYLQAQRRTVVQEAMRWWTEATDGCITFTERTDEEDYIVYKHKDKGCASFVGRSGGEQILSIGSDCLVGNIAHEIGHAIGLWHEHSRKDRDTFIKIVRENLIDELQGDRFNDNFGILSDKTLEMVPDLPYDISSIMHYGPYFFTRHEAPLNMDEKKTIMLADNSPVLKCKNKEYEESMGQRVRIADKDALAVKILYGCAKAPESNEFECPYVPTPTPTESTRAPETITTPKPTPTTTRLKSLDIITLNVENETASYGLQCSISGGCHATTRCLSLPGFENCVESNDFKFQFIKVMDSESRLPQDQHIRVGDKVVLKWVEGIVGDTTHVHHRWLNCSGHGHTSCAVKSCTSNAAESNTSFTSDCPDHFFTVESRKRKKGRLLVIGRDPILLKSYNHDKRVNCAGNKCELRSPGDCKDPSSPEHGNKGLRDGLIKRTKSYCLGEEFNTTLAFKTNSTQ